MIPASCTFVNGIDKKSYRQHHASAENRIFFVHYRYLLCTYIVLCLLCGGLSSMYDKICE